jgi:secretion/DNA translocation related CpaE-like protein
MNRELADLRTGFGVDEGPGSAGARPLVVSRDAACIDELARLCAAIAVVPDVVGDPARLGARWADAPCVLIDVGCAGDVAALRLRRRDDVVMIGRHPPTDTLWRRAVEIGAADLAVLPADGVRVANRLADAATPDRTTAAVIGVVGAAGGVGASTVAAGLASVFAGGSLRSLLVDADPLGGGIELVMGCEQTPGLRWADVQIEGGRVAARSLLAALPSADGVSVLSVSTAAAAEIDAHALRAMIDGGRRACQLVVVDLPRILDSAAGQTALAQVDLLVVVGATDVRSIAAGRPVVGAAAGVADVQAVVRTTRGRGLEPEAVADGLGLSLAGVVPTQGAVARARDDGGGVARGRLTTRHYRRLLAALLPGAVR